MKWLNILRIICFVLICIFFVVGIRHAIHDPEQIGVQLTKVTTKSDDAYYYVYYHYEIKNESMKSIKTVYVSVTFRDASGSTVGKLTSKFEDLDLEPGDTVSMKSYLQERMAGYHGDLFLRTYQNGLKDLTMSYEIVFVRWTDGYTSGDSWAY